MYLNLNCIILAGSVCETPELRYTSNGTPVTNFSMKTIKSRKDSTTGEIIKDKRTHKIVCWKGNAIKATKILEKGDNALVVGEMNYIKSTTESEEHIVTPEIKAISVDGCKTVSSVSSLTDVIQEQTFVE